MTTSYSAAFTGKELVEMLDQDFETQTSAARRIWSDWDVISDKEMVLEKASDIHTLLTNTEQGKHTWHFALALGCMRYEEALPDILTLVKEGSDENIRGFAAEALSRYDPSQISQKVIDTLWSILENSNPLVVKVNTIRVFENIYSNSKDDSIAKRLIGTIATDSHPFVNSQLIKLIGSVGSTVVTPELVHMLVARRTELDIDAAASALDKIAMQNGYKNRKELINSFNFDDNIEF